MRGPITLGTKRTGKPGAGEPHAGFDVAGAGDVVMGAGLRPTAKAVEGPPDPKANAPALDPTDERGVETEPRSPRYSSTLLIDWIALSPRGGRLLTLLDE